MLVTITFDLSDLGGDEIDSTRDPRLWIRLADWGSRVSPDYMIADVEKRVTDFSSATGVGSVEVESWPGVKYQFILDWQAPNPRVDPARWARKRTEWEPFHPGNGGRLADLMPLRSYGPIVAGFGAPPPGTPEVVWIDISDNTAEGAMVYAPEGTF